MMIRAQIEPEDLTTEQIYKLVEEYMGSEEYARLLKADQYYKGGHDILERPTGSANTDVHNTLVNNFPGYIVDVNVGYFMGNPVSYTSASENELFMEELQMIFDKNDEQDKNMILAKSVSIKGKVYELLYLNEDSEVCFAPIQPENLILIYDTTVSPKPKFALRFWLIPDLFEDEEKLYIDLYTAREIVSYEAEGDDIQEIERRGHSFEEVPIIEYINNDERQGDFDKVISLIDAYDKAQSDVANDFEASADAYLVIRNMSGTQEEDLAEMRKRRAIFVDDDGEASWLIKNVNDAAQENYKSRLQMDIHRFSLTPNLTDENFAGTVTGVALQYKMWGLEQRAAQKERKFKQSLQRRIELICKIMSVKGKDEVWSDIAISFSRNAPAVLPEIIDMVTKLRDFVSDLTLLSLLPFIPDPVEEYERVEEQRGSTVDLDKVLYGEGMQEPEEAEEPEVEL